MPVSNIRRKKKKILIADRQNILSVNKAAVRKIAREFFRHEKVEFSVSIVLADNKLIRSLNRQYLKRDYSTDVLAFLLEQEGDVDDLKGEVVISLEKAKENACVFFQSLEEEISLYLIHGLLHLLGYSDYPASLRRKMKKKEEEILAGISKKTIKSLLRP